MNTGVLDGWLRRQSRKELKRATLEDVLVFGRFHRYLVYRTGRFVVTRLAEALLHVCELGLLFLLAEQEVFIAAAAVTIGGHVVSHAWWGALEPLRSGVRTRAHDGRYGAIAGWIRLWLRAATVLTAAGVGIAVAYAVVSVVDRSFDVGRAYAVARVVGLALELLARTFHAGVYALRRIYQPMWSLLAPSLLRGAMLLALWPALGVWSTALAVLGSAMAGALLNVRFTWRAYEDLRIRPTASRPRGPRRRQWSGRDAVAVARAAAASIAGVAAHLFAMVVLSLSTGDAELWINAFVYVVLAAPMLDACIGWTRLFYPDLMKLQDDLLRPYRVALHGHILRWAPAIATALWLPTLLVLRLVPHEGEAVTLGALTWLFFVTRARIAAVQTIAFCDGRYGRIFLLSGVVAVSAGVAWLNTKPELWWLAVLVLLGSVLVPAAPSPRLLTRPVVPLAAAIARGARIPGRGTWVLAECRTGRLLHGPYLLLHRFARRVGMLGAHRDRLLLWWEPESSRPRPGAEAVYAFETRRWRSPVARAPEALAALRRDWPGRIDRGPSSIDDVISEFRGRFTDAFWVRAGVVAPPELRRLLTWKERQAVLAEAVTHLYGRPPGTALSLDVTALVDDGQIAVLFFVKRDVAPASRRGWRHRVRALGVASAFAALGPADIGPPSLPR